MTLIACLLLYVETHRHTQYIMMKAVARQGKGVDIIVTALD